MFFLFFCWPITFFVLFCKHQDKRLQVSVCIIYNSKIVTYTRCQLPTIVDQIKSICKFKTEKKHTTHAFDNDKINEKSENVHCVSSDIWILYLHNDNNIDITDERLHCIPDISISNHRFSGLLGLTCFATSKHYKVV